MASTKSIVIDWMYRQDLPKSITCFDDFLIEAAKHSLGKDQIQAEQFAMGRVREFWNSVNNCITKDIREKRIPMIEVTENLRREFRCPFEHRRTGDATSRKFLRARSRSSLLAAIDILSETEYERAVGGILRLMGSGIVRITPPTNDSGIDTFGAIKIATDGDFLIERKGPVRIVIQSKKKTLRLPESNVKEFSDTLDSVRKRSRQIRIEIPSWFTESDGPIIGWLVSHSGFQSSAISTARDRGILLSHSLDLADFLSSSEALSESIVADRRVGAFRSLLQSTLTAVDLKSIA